VHAKRQPAVDGVTVSVSLHDRVQFDCCGRDLQDVLQRWIGRVARQEGAAAGERRER